MTLYKLLENVKYEGQVEDISISSVSSDSRQIRRGDAFFCIRGERSDGHEYAAVALEKGAAVVVAERDLGLANQILVEDSHEAYGVACAALFGNPARDMMMIGVTGTNGKTTVTSLVKQILTMSGYKVGLIGTIHNEIGEAVVPTKHTTPDAYQFHAMLARMKEAGCTHVVMEVSSHALDQKRVAGIRFAASAFTNLTQDHLDYHKNMENYYNAKKGLFLMSDNAVINYDDVYGKRMLEEVPCVKYTFSCESDEADYTAHNIKYNEKGSQFALLEHGNLRKVHISQPGSFSVSNAMAAAVICIVCGMKSEYVVEALENCKSVMGRLEILPTNTPYTVIRDYAHTPDGLEKAISTVKEFAPGRVVTLFGCAGNRDRSKRHMMAEAAARYSDFCILTSDNPRDEDPRRIINDALPGIQNSGTMYKVIIDRYEAIQWALTHSRPDDILILAGKGHEDYQVLEYGTINFDEREIVFKLLGIEDEG